MLRISYACASAVPILSEISDPISLYSPRDLPAEWEETVSPAPVRMSYFNDGLNPISHKLTTAALDISALTALNSAGFASAQLEERRRARQGFSAVPGKHRHLKNINQPY